MPRDYEKNRENQRIRDDARSRRNREIGKPREVYDDERRAAAIASLESFLLSYFPKAFPVPFSDDHRRAIRTIEEVFRDGGLHALAMPRGDGKTTIATRAAIWAILSGLRRYPVIISAREDKAKKLLKYHIVQNLCFNRDLILDFPNELHGLHQLRGSNKKSAGQICDGVETRPAIMASFVIFPTHQYTPNPGAAIATCGLTGDIRGLNHTREDGSVIRPDLIILDDPQTRESATSGPQSAEREEIIYGDVLGLAGQDREIAAVMPCTVVAKGDLADRILANPEWHATRSKKLYAFPSNMALWDQYFEIRTECRRTGAGREPADNFYRTNQTEMERGAVEGWPGRKKENDITSLQSVMHLYHRNPAAFAAEYQNEPLDAAQSLDEPTFAGLAEKLNRLPRGTVPVWATKLTVGIDVQQRCLFWLVAAWANDFSGAIVDYGAWPRQSRAYYGLADVSPTLQQASGLSQIEAAWRWGLDGLADYLLSRPLRREGSGEIAISQALVDANYGPSTDTVYEFCRRSPFGGVLVPSHGRGVKAGDRPMAEWPKKPGETHGANWIKTPGDNKRAVLHVKFDTDAWKTLLAARAGAAVGEKGSLSLCGDKPEPHRMLFDHLAAESPVKTSGRGREVWEWNARPNADNHWLDCLVMAAVAASMQGCALPGTENRGSGRDVVVIPKHLRSRAR